MYQGTTPSIELTIAGYDLTDAAVFVTIENGKWQETFEGDRLDVSYENETTTISITLTQEETFQLPVGTMRVQVRWVDTDDLAWVTEEQTLSVNSVLLKKVISRPASE